MHPTKLTTQSEPQPACAEDSLNLTEKPEEKGSEGSAGVGFTLIGSVRGIWLIVIDLRKDLRWRFWNGGAFEFHFFLVC